MFERRAPYSRRATRTTGGWRCASGETTVSTWRGRGRAPSPHRRSRPSTGCGTETAWLASPSRWYLARKVIDERTADEYLSRVGIRNKNISNLMSIARGAIFRNISDKAKLFTYCSICRQQLTLPTRQPQRAPQTCGCNTKLVASWLMFP